MTNVNLNFVSDVSRFLSSFLSFVVLFRNSFIPLGLTFDDLLGRFEAEHMLGLILPYGSGKSSLNVLHSAPYDME